MSNSVEFERHKNVGGSDVGALLGVSKFSTPEDVLYSKLSEEKRKDLGIETKPFKGNIYTEVGNIFEEKIQECLGLKHDQERYYGEIDGFGLRVHIDGAYDIEAEDIGLHEIKVVSYVGKSGKPYEMHKKATKDKVLNDYMPQLQFQMYLTNQKKNTLTILPRNNSIKNELKKVRTLYGLSNLQDQGEFDDDILWKTVVEDLRDRFKDNVVSKEDLILVEVKRDDEQINFIKENIKVLVKYIRLLESCNCEFECLSLVQDYLEELSNLKSVDKNELMEQSNKVLLLEKQLTDFKKIEKEYKYEKLKLEQLMLDNGIKKWETPNGIKISRGDDTPEETIKVIDYEKAFNHLKNVVEEVLIEEALFIGEEQKVVKGKKGSFRITIPQKLLK